MDLNWILCLYYGKKTKKGQFNLNLTLDGQKNSGIYFGSTSGLRGTMGKTSSPATIASQGMVNIKLGSLSSTWFCFVMPNMGALKRITPSVPQSSNSTNRWSNIFRDSLFFFWLFWWILDNNDLIRKDHIKECYWDFSNIY